MLGIKTSFIGYFLFITANSQLVTEEIPVCPSDIAKYRCTNKNDGGIEWYFHTPSNTETVSLVHLITPTGHTQTRQIAGIAVVFEVSAANSSFIRATATISDPVGLNGIRMTCQSEDILLNFEFGILPTQLRVVKDDAGIDVYPNNNEINNTYFSLDSAMNNRSLTTNPIYLSQPATIHFFRCRNNNSFTIDSCIFEVGNKEVSYTNHMNGTWSIIRKCSMREVLVRCINGSWNNNIKCDFNDMNIPNELLLESFAPHKLLSLYIATVRPMIPNNSRVILSPTSLSEPFYINDNRTVILYLESNTKYNLTITTIDGINYYFSGKCPILAHSSKLLVTQYNLTRSPYNMSATFRCTTEENNAIHHIQCMDDGQWNTNVVEICNFNSNTQLNTDEVEYVIRVGQVAGGIVGSFIVALILGIALGLLCGLAFIKKIMAQNNSQGKLSSSRNDECLNMGPLYEDVALDKNIELSHNVSYDVVKK